jgi:hypothetical protein
MEAIVTTAWSAPATAMIVSLEGRLEVVRQELEAWQMRVSSLISQSSPNARAHQLSKRTEIMS